MSSPAAPSARVPTATYRLQIQPDYPLPAAALDVPYLASLGVSHLHLSPVLEAVPGSGHGYDVTDPARVRAELGGEQGLRALSRTAAEHGLRLVLDIVPNHMALPADTSLNRPLWEVLRHGPQSPWARWFDIDWAAGGGRILLPVLGGRLGSQLDALSVVNGELRYGPHRFPLRDGTADLPLPALLDAQHYRLAWWRLARTDLNYRRFFSISELIGVRVEDEEVFGAVHERALALLRDGVAHGLRIDHPDGLTDPARYLRRLHAATGGTWTVVEKILAADERLPADWPADGTTGYDALRHLDGLFVDPQGVRELSRSYAKFTAVPADRGADWAATVRAAAHEVIGHELAAEVARLVRAARRILDDSPDPALRDHADWALATAVREILVRLPVYRVYPPTGPEETALLTAAARDARSAFAVPEEAETLDVVCRLACDHPEFAPRFAQVSAALRAKSVEDTAFYRYIPLLSAAEVGGDPGRPAVDPAEFHAFCTRVQRDWPATGTVLSTHDAKRSADVRASLAVLSECPERWTALLEQVTGGGTDRHTAWLVWQTAFGLGEADRDRLLPAVLKSVREAGLRTSWTEQDAAYEAEVERLVEDGPCGPPGRALGALADELDGAARGNTLGMALLHLTMPGVPDLYQGTERPYRALVDPDNRAPQRFPEPLPSGEPPAGAGEKLRLTVTALRLRRAHPQWFGADGDYRPLSADGPAAAHCVAFVRADRVLPVATRLSRRLAERGGWAGTVLPLPAGQWRDALTDRTFEGPCPLADLLTDSPVALLVRQ
ncbi:malto-oligosyltrehalose synthase [Streptomyces sp. 549]|uniref:malto-oligosyltrehalose synthase n=1 Tax=Streptomyces sp. 549 TaxID=3049076 RepID=UPI0024C23828|nr:malto-oligosyltrehalose synthase [Streptomyces sp. 549]MDK1475207.1 malto-oligosyltrehalose synthase [Streptomyces sp. 549]